MAGNSFGKIFRITTFGESHGEGVGVVIDGCPPRINMSTEDFVQEMTRRRPGRAPFDTPRTETDKVEIISGVFEGLTTGDADGFRPGLLSTGKPRKLNIFKDGKVSVEEAFYSLGFVDGESQPLNGANKYTITFNKGEFPPVKGFWSLK